ncbi:hypothetical protein [Deinococcus koreensis]|uniref:Thiol:disulfide interchange protein DsbD N-terminal domain-containing protein n=1 Tax=Deinococcus koreensis TaxID=2054903 RepID=A0A2K3UU60_9DEIO|nr:hypothetical protein [Deinococcus koreensis]PNY80066.1 hypothetical protein CVO96_00695 [Deinococcus koreensis]
MKRETTSVLAGLITVLAVVDASALLPSTTASTSLLIRFTTPPGIGFNRRGASTLSVVAAGSRQSFVLRGIPDPADPVNTLLRLDDLRIPLPQTRGGRITLKATFFLCDRVNGVCTVQEKERVVTVIEGQTKTVNWSVGRPSR